MFRTIILCGPGNIREFENIIQRAVIKADGSIGVEDLPKT